MGTRSQTAFALGSKQKNRLGGRKEAKRALWAPYVRVEPGEVVKTLLSNYDTIF